MFYITAHTVTQNQFTNVVNDVQFPNIESPSVCIDIPAALGMTSSNDMNKRPIILLPCDLYTRNHIKSLESCGKLHQNIIADGLRYKTFYISNSFYLSLSKTLKILIELNEFQSISIAKLR